MAHGTVKWFDRDRGFGLIAAADGGPDLLVERGGAPAGDEVLRAQEIVAFEIVVGPKGPQAVDVRAGTATDLAERQRRDQLALR
ncbi:cold-shock protein [Nocardia sp. NPDC001965]